jgi:hypothetical protein
MARHGPVTCLNAAVFYGLSAAADAGRAKATVNRHFYIGCCCSRPRLHLETCWSKRRTTSSINAEGTRTQVSAVEKQLARQPRRAAEAVLAVDPAAAAKLKP